MAAAVVGEALMTDTTEGEFVLHPEPVWRDKANFIVHAELAVHDQPRKFEQLWTRQVDETHFEVCCIPFFLYDVSLGDVVETVPRGGRKYVVHRVTRPSGHYTFRAYFGRSAQSPEKITEDLTGLGALIEWSSPTLLAIDALDLAHAQMVADFLQEREQVGDLMFETGKSA